MSSTDFRKMAFYEVGKGRLAMDAQTEFERMIKECQEKNVGATLTIKIKVDPPNPREPDFGQLNYSVGVAMGALNSQKFTTLIKEGNIVADGDDPTETVKLDLELPKPTTAERLRLAQGG